VESIFSEKYQATIGVKIDRKLVELDETQVSLLLWDLQGEDDLQKVRMSYPRGAAGLIFVADGTRPETVETARDPAKRRRDHRRSPPSSCSTSPTWTVPGRWTRAWWSAAARGSHRSARRRTGDNVDAAFL
jgi:GTPase SAR1 family protein